MQIFLPNVDGIGNDFLSLVRERIEVRVINLAKAACKDDSTPHPRPSPRSRRRSDRQSRKHSGLPYRFFFVQASMRSSAFSMFSIEFATLKRR